MPQNNSNNSPSEFDNLFTHKSDEDELKSETRLLNLRFLSEIEKFSDQKRGLKQRLAGMVGTSASYITQLFNGDKIVNLEMIAKFQKALKIKFKITAYSEEDFEYCYADLQISKNVFHFTNQQDASNFSYERSTNGEESTLSFTQFTPSRASALS